MQYNFSIMTDTELKQKIEKALEPTFEHIVQVIFGTYKSLNDKLKGLSDKDKEQIILSNVEESTKALQRAVDMIGGK